MAGFFNTIKGIQNTGRLLTLLSQNQAIITNNIANVDTPNYVKQNTNFEQVLGSIRSPIETELAKKVGPCPLLSEGDGKVNLETELMNMQKNFIYYSMVTRRAGSIINIVKNIGQIGR